MYISEEYKLIYLAAPKTASRSTINTLMGRFGFVESYYSDSPLVALRTEYLPKHHQVLYEHPGDGWGVITTVRNHWDAFYSWFRYSPRHHTVFDVSFLESHVAHYADTFNPEPDSLYRLWTMHADLVMRYESIENDISVLFREEVKLPRLNQSWEREGKTYRDFYNFETKLWVAEHYAEEIKEYDYEF